MKHQYRRYVSLGLNDPGRPALAIASHVVGPNNYTFWKPAMCCWYSLAIRATKGQMREIEALWIADKTARGEDAEEAGGGRMTWLCWLGFHRWDYRQLAISDVAVVNRQCWRCKLEQIFARGPQKWIKVSC